MPVGKPRRGFPCGPERHSTNSGASHGYNPNRGPADAAPVKLPYGVEDVLKLSRAQVSEDVTLNFIRNSGTIYNLAPRTSSICRTRVFLTA